MPKKWYSKKQCKNCKRFKTWGGVKKLFGLRKIETWEHNFCQCKKAEDFPYHNDTGKDDVSDFSEDEICQKNG